MTDAAFTRNTAPGPEAAMTTPANAGPADCATLREMESRPTARGSSSRPTSSGVNAMNAGPARVRAIDNTNVPASSSDTVR